MVCLAGAGRIFEFLSPPLFLLVFVIVLVPDRKPTWAGKFMRLAAITEAARLNGISVWKTRLFVMCVIQVAILSGVMNSAQVHRATFGFGRGWGDPDHLLRCHRRRQHAGHQIWGT